MQDTCNGADVYTCLKNLHREKVHMFWYVSLMA